MKFKKIRNPDIVIATPGRLIDHLQNTPSFSLEAIEVLILVRERNYFNNSALDVPYIFF